MRYVHKGLKNDTSVLFNIELGSSGSSGMYVPRKLSPVLKKLSGGIAPSSNQT
jgi:hypothetical protein